MARQPDSLILWNTGVGKLAIAGMAPAIQEMALDCLLSIHRMILVATAPRGGEDILHRGEIPPIGLDVPTLLSRQEGSASAPELTTQRNRRATRSSGSNCGTAGET